jgi:GTP-binding protein HflX
MLQVTLAKSQYMLPRLTGSRDDLSGQGGGRGSIGGAGEQKLETDRRVLRNNIIRCRKSLAVIVTQRRAQRTHRMSNEEFTVSIVGYTNVGKSTLMNQLMGRSMKKAKKKVFEKDMLFATLETAARQIVLPQNRPILLVDTVGFVRHMPAHLIEAFKSTLEEIAESDLILHVVDGSNPEQILQMEVVNKVLMDLGASEIPVIYVRNKMDKSVIPNDKWDHPRVDISAKTGLGIPMLIQEIKDHMKHIYEDVVLVFPFERADLYSILKRIADIHEEDIGRDTITVDASVPKKDLSLFSAFIVNRPRKIHKNAA